MVVPQEFEAKAGAEGSKSKKKRKKAKEENWSEAKRLRFDKDKNDQTGERSFDGCSGRQISWTRSSRKWKGRIIIRAQVRPHSLVPEVQGWSFRIQRKFWATWCPWWPGGFGYTAYFAFVRCRNNVQPLPVARRQIRHCIHRTGNVPTRGAKTTPRWFLPRETNVQFAERANRDLSRAIRVLKV